MKWLIALLLTCSSVLGQGFGSFTYDQPFLAGPSSSTFYPSNIAGLWLDLDASRVGQWTVAPNTDGSQLTNSPDWSPNHRETTMLASSGAFIRWRNENSGLWPTNTYFNWTNYNGNGMLAAGTNGPLNNPWTFMAIMRVDPAKYAAQSYAFGGSGGTPSDNACLYLPDSSTIQILSFYGLNSQNAFVANKWFLFTAVYGTNYNQSSIRTNGYINVKGTSDLTFSYRTYPVAVGTLSYNNAQFFPGDMARILVWNRALSDGECQWAETNLFASYKLEPRATPASLGTWNPTTNSSALSVYDVDAQSYNVGDLVSSLPDQTPKAFHLLATGAARPYATNNGAFIGNRKYISFNGSSTYLATNFTTSFPQPTTVFMVARVPANSTASAKMAFDCAGDAAVYQGLYVQFSSTANTYINAGTAVGHTRQTTDWSIWEVKLNGASSYIKTNNVQMVSGNFGANARKGSTFGADRTGALFCDMDLAFAAIYTNSLTATESSNIVYYLQNRFPL